MLCLRSPLALSLVALVTLPLHAAPPGAPDLVPDLVTTVVPGGLPDDAALTAPRVPRLRPQSPRMRAWLTRGLERSATMRALAHRVAGGDVIVYLDLARRLDVDIAACVTWVSAVPGARYLRVSVRPTLRDADAIAMIAHELQHVVEVIDHPDVRSREALNALYQRIGHRTSQTGVTWDTLAAYDSGNRARLEITRGGRTQAGV